MCPTTLTYFCLKIFYLVQFYRPEQMLPSASKLLILSTTNADNAYTRGVFSHTSRGGGLDFASPTKAQKLDIRFFDMFKPKDTNTWMIIKFVIFKISNAGSTRKQIFVLF